MLIAVACTINPAVTPAEVVTPQATPFPTANDQFYGSPALYERELGGIRQVVKLGVSPDFAGRPVLPFYGLGLQRPELASALFEAVTRNHYYRWQESDWAARGQVPFEDFERRLGQGENMSYAATDTRSGARGAHPAIINPAAGVEILLIPRHEGFITFPAGPTDPGLSIKNTISSDGSVRIRVPLVYAQIVPYSKGDAEIQEIVTTSIIIALMELGIPHSAIENNSVAEIAQWWETSPDADAHRRQYTELKGLLTDMATNTPIIRILEDPLP
jgi:hypothetical protein